MAQQALLNTVKSVFLWQKIVLFFWTIALIRRIYYLYDFAHYVFSGMEEDTALVIEFTLRIIIQAIQLVIYTMMVRETFNLTAHIKAYTDEASKKRFAMLVHSQQKVWKYLGISFAIGILLMVYNLWSTYFSM